MPRLALLPLLLLSACTQLLTEPPPVSDSTMVEVLVELHLAEAFVTTATPLPPAMREAILQRHQLTEADFEEAVHYYAEHPEAYAALYEQVVDVLNEERSSLHPSNEAASDSTDAATNAAPTAP